MADLPPVALAFWQFSTTLARYTHRVAIANDRILALEHDHVVDDTERLLEREQDPSTAWKLNAGDWQEREHWEEYTKAYEDVLERCSTARAPWRVVPADAKWYRNLVIAEDIVAAMRTHRKTWDETLEEKGRAGRASVEEYRKGKGKPRP